MPRFFNAKARPEDPSTAFAQACEIMPKERVLSIHDAVQFLGSNPQTIESAIDLAISTDELAKIAAAGTHVLAPIFGTPQTLCNRGPTKFAHASRPGPRSIARINPSKFPLAPSGYRLIRVGPHPGTVGKEFLEQQQILWAEIHGQWVCSPHALSLAALMFHELRGIDLIGPQFVRTSDPGRTLFHTGMRFENGRILMDLVNGSATACVGAVGEVFL